jgi:hydroxyacylglutathione hydrolase
MPTGDTLFALGCGRLFEGHPEMMWTSLSKLLPLPRDTLVYCAHEYTQSNARFAVTVDPNNEALQKRKEAIDAARKKVCWCCRVV